MEKKIRQYIEQHHMIAPGDTVCVGLSGGADSVCLLLILLDIYDIRNRADGSGELKTDNGAEHSGRPEAKTEETVSAGRENVHICAVHVNHQLRGDDADRDEQFVRELCDRLGIPLAVYRYSVREIAKEKGVGVEEAGRLARHEAYRDCREKSGATVIALAHHANDCAETFLFHAARGASLAGVAGIRPVQMFSLSGSEHEKREEKTDGSQKHEGFVFSGKQNTGKSRREWKIVRPLLCVTREEIETWLTERGQSWRIDATNSDETYARNAIRHTVIPLMENRINTQAVRHMAETAADLSEADRFLQKEARRRAKQHMQLSAQEIRVDSFFSEEPAILQGYMLLDAMEYLGGSRKDLGREQVRQLRELFGLQTGKRIDLPYDLCAVREYEGIRLYKRRTGDREEGRIRAGREDGSGGIGTGTEDNIVVNTDAAESICLWNGWKFHVRVREIPHVRSGTETTARWEDIPRKKYTKWLDCDKINGTLCIRSRKEGDRLTVTAQGGSRKLKDYLIDEKIPRRERERIPLLTLGQKVFWVVGYRISEDAKVTDATRRVLEITAEPVYSYTEG